MKMSAKVRTLRRNPLGRNALQERQRGETRQRLVQAARRVFERQSYAETRVEDVLAEATISRATFYTHFDGKLAIVRAIAAEFLPVWQAHFDKLSAMARFALPALESWTRQYVDIYRKNEATCILLTQVSALEPEFYWQLAGEQEALIARLGDSIPAFARSRADSADGRSAHMRASLLLSQLDQVGYFLAIRRWKSDPETGIRVMAEQLEVFLNASD